MHQIHLGNELFYISKLPKAWSMQFYLMLEVALNQDDTRRNILYLTDGSSNRNPYPAIFVRNNIELTFCYGNVDFCITASPLDTERWYSIHILIRNEKTFEGIVQKWYSTVFKPIF